MSFPIAPIGYDLAGGSSGVDFTLELDGEFELILTEDLATDEVFDLILDEEFVLELEPDEDEAHLFLDGEIDMELENP